jgi:hypothetical protein
VTILVVRCVRGRERTLTPIGIKVRPTPANFSHHEGKKGLGIANWVVAAFAVVAEAL